MLLFRILSSLKQETGRKNTYQKLQMITKQMKKSKGIYF